MSNDTPPVCARCGQAVQFAGRVGLPPMIIYRCNSCDLERWAADEHPDTARTEPLKT